MVVQVWRACGSGARSDVLACAVDLPLNGSKGRWVRIYKSDPNSPSPLPASTSPSLTFLFFYYSDTKEGNREMRESPTQPGAAEYAVLVEVHRWWLRARRRRPCCVRGEEELNYGLQLMDLSEELSDLVEDWI